MDGFSLFRVKAKAKQVAFKIKVKARPGVLRRRSSK